MNAQSKKTVIFICKHNSARSQMAEGILKNLYPDNYDVYSAGTKPDKLNPIAVKVMAERGIDISMNRSKSINEFKDQEFNYVVTVCEENDHICPFLPGGKRYIHKYFTDPTSINGNNHEMSRLYTQIRNEIEDWIKETF